MKSLYPNYWGKESLPILAALFSLLLFVALVPSAAATPVTWNLTGVTFAEGGSATGWFTFDESLGTKQIMDWNVVATVLTLPSPLLGPNPFTFTKGNSVGLGGTTGFSFTTNELNVDRDLSLLLATPLTFPGPITLLTNVTGYTASTINPPLFVISDLVVSGEIVASSVPEPGSLLLLGSGLVGLVKLRRRVRR